MIISNSRANGRLSCKIGSIGPPPAAGGLSAGNGLQQWQPDGARSGATPGMARQKKYRLSDKPADSAESPRGAPRWLIGIPLLAGAFIAMALISGALLPAVLSTLFNLAWVLVIVLPALLLGLAMTAPVQSCAAIRASIWPDDYRLVLSTALGLGAISLGTLLLGSLHLLHGYWPAALLAAAAAGGYPAARNFFTRMDCSPLKAPLRRQLFWLLPACLPVALLLTAACFPAGSLWHTEGNGYDVLEYHLQLPHQFLLANSTAPVHGNIYSFLPLNIEMLYLILAAVARTVLHNRIIYVLVYGAQLLHALIVLLAGLAVALAPIRMNSAGRIVALLVFLATPWTLVVGSLAYNDGGVLLYGALAFGLALADLDWPMTLVLGLLIGLSVDCKMTSGVLIAVPAAAMLLARRNVAKLAVVTLAALVLYSPWMARSMVYTHTRTSIGNPVFPIFSGTLGRGHWPANLAHRFDRGHRPPPRDAGIAAHARALLSQTVLDRQWSPGIAAYAAAAAPHPGFPSAKTPWPLRLGLIWLLVIPVLALALFTGPSAWLLALCLLVQLAAWLTCTQLQARFSLPFILPLALLFGLAAEFRPKLGLLVRGLLVLQCLFCLLLLRPEAGLFLGPLNPRYRPFIGGIFSLPADWIVDLNGMQFPHHARWYLEGDSAALYMRGRYMYNTVFNRNRLARALAKSGPRGAVQWLQRHHIDYVILDWPEVYRLRKTYGFNPDISPVNIGRMVRAGLQPVPVETLNGIQIFHVP